jgi:protein tyrosine/serine phosphatase
MRCSKLPVPTDADALDRALQWDGCLNVRDFGGLPTEAGGLTNRGAILRADSIRKLTNAGWDALHEYGIVRVVDLRFDSELADDPPRELSLEVVHVSVLPDLDSQHWKEIDAIGDAAPDAASGNCAVYLEFLERFPSKFAEAIQAISDADGAVLIHCVGGKDRTGLVSALVLRLAGVSVEAVAGDYSLSEANLRPETAEWIAQAKNDFERSQRERRSQTPAETMVRVLEELENRYGTVSNYLLSAGVTESGLQKLRDRLSGGGSSS